MGIKKENFDYKFIYIQIRFDSKYMYIKINVNQI